MKEMVEVGGQKTYRPSARLKLAPGAHRLAFATESDEAGFKGKFPPLELRPKMRLVGPLDAARAEYPESHRRIFFKGPAPADPAARRDYAREIMQRIADRAFRRPATAADGGSPADLALSAPEFERGVAQGLMAILTSPKFLFRAELQPQPDDPKAIHPIDEFALASRLSYLLWLSLPDDELRGLADRGELRENLPAQAAAHAGGPEVGAVLRGLSRPMAAHAQRA